MKKQFKKLLCYLMSFLVIMANFFAGSFPVRASNVSDRQIEVTLAADAVSNNLDLTGFSDKLKAKLNTTYGIAVDKIHIKTVDSSTANSNGFPWYRFDHTNTSGNALSNTNNNVIYYSDPNINNDTSDPYHYALNQPYHIGISTDGQAITFYGYGTNAYKDFLFAPNGNANNKIFTFSMNESTVSYHSADGNGFLFDASYSNDGTTRRLSGYLVLIGSTNVGLYELKNVDVSQFQEEGKTTFFSNPYGYPNLTSTSTTYSYWGGTERLLSSITKPATSNAGKDRFLKLVASPTEVSLYQFADNTYSTTSTNGVMFDHIALPDNFGSFGFGPISSYAYHSCGRGTVGVFSNLSLKEDTSVGFADLVRSTTWQYPDSIKVIANVDNDGVSDFGSIDKLSSILYYTMLNNVHYIGWGINNTINKDVGGYTSVKDQANGFITRNSGKGTFINRSDSSYDSLDEGVDAIAAYIAAQLPSVPDITKPTLITTFGTSSSVTCRTTDTQTSNGNPIGAYKWKYLDIATGAWSDETATTNSDSFTFPQNAYRMVALSIEDSVTGQWSDYSYAYIATVPTVQPISQFSIDKNTLMPDSSVAALRTGTVVTATDNSYLPNGGAITDWEWKVYDPALNEITALGKTYTSSTKPSSISFDFSGKPAGNYTIKLRTKNGSNDWSSQYSQQVMLYKESSAITISTTNNTASPNIYTGTKAIPFTISSTGGNITAYRIIKALKSGSNSIGDWTKVNVASVSGSQNVADTSCDVYVQAIDASGNSKTQFVGTYLTPLSITSVYVGTSTAYINNTPTNKNVTFNSADTGIEYSTNNGSSFSSFTSPMTVSTSGKYIFRYAGVTDTSSYVTINTNINTNFSGSISGVNNNGIYNTDVTPVVTNATATISKDGAQAATFTTGTVISDEGNYSIVLTDIYGNTATYNFVIDKTAPAIPTLSADNTNPTNTNVTVTIVYPSDASVKQYKTSTGSWVNYTAPIVLSANDTISAQAKDAAGNTSPMGSLTVSNIDKTAPTAPTLAADKTTPTNTDVTVTITYPSDASVKQYKTSGGNWTNYTAPVVLSANDTISAQCEDAAGNVSPIGSLTVSNIDKTAPLAPTLVADKTYLTNTNVTVTITYPSDASVKQYKTSTGNWTNYTGPVVLSANDAISAQCQDAAGNTSSMGSLTVSNIDKVNPTISITGNPTAWTSNDAVLNISTTAGISGVQSVTAQKDNGTVVNITGQNSYTVSSNGAYKFIVTNGAGVTTTNIVNVTHIDKAVPAINIDNIKTNGNVYSYSAAVPTEHDVNFALSDINAVISGVTFYWSSDGTSWNPIAGKNFTVSSTNDATVNYKFKAVSGSGLESLVSAANPVYIIKPSFTNDISIDAETSDNKVYTGNWTNKDITYILSKGINGSAFLKYQYSTNPFDSSSWTDMEGIEHNTITVSNETNAVYYFRAVSKGLSYGSQTNGTTLQIDKTVPTDVTISLKGNSFKQFLNKITFGMFSKDNVDVNITADSNISGTKYIEYQLVDTNKGESYDAVNGKWVKYTSLSISPQFKGVIYARAMDNAGNLSAVVSSDGLAVDNVQPTAPVITAATSDGSPYTDSWTNKNVVLVASDASALAGIDHYEYKFGTSGTWTTMPEQSTATDATSGKAINDRLTITEPIDGTYYFRAVSSSRIVGQETSKVVRLENTAPATKVSSTGTVDAWTKAAVTFNVSNTNKDIICPVTTWIKIGNNDWANVPTGSYTFDAEINVPVMFKTVTGAGLENIDSKTYNVMIDKTAPVISGAQAGNNYYIGRVITIVDNSNASYNSVYTKDNGSNVNLSSGDLISAPGAYGITVTDQASNVSTLNFAIKQLPSVSDVLYTPEWDTLIKNIRNEFDAHTDLPEPYKTNTDTAIKALENRYKALDTEVNTIKQETADIKKNVNELPAVNDGLIAMLDTIQKEYDKVAGDNSTLTAEEKAVLIGEKNYLQQLLDTIKGLKDSNTAIISRANAITTGDDGLIAKKDAIKAILNDAAALTNEQKAILKPTTDALNALLAKISELQSQVDSEAAKAAAIPTADDGLIAQKDAIQKILNEISKLTPEQKKLLQDKTDALNNLLARANALQASVDDINTRAVDALKGDGGLVLQREKIIKLLDEISKLTPEQKNLLKEQIDRLNATLQADMDKLKDLDADVASLKIIYGSGDSANSVTKAMYLPIAGSNGSVITWSSPDTSKVTNTGRITRPEPEAQDMPITLTASVRDPKTNEVITKQFNITLKKLSDQEAANEAAKQLTVESALSFDSSGDTWESVTNRFLLLNKGAYSSTITWQSNKPSIINISTNGNDTVGTVTRPEDKDEDVILTATVKKGAGIATKTFLIVVKPKNVTKQASSVRVDTNTNATIASDSNETPVDVKIKRTTLDNNAGIVDTLIITSQAMTTLTDNINPTSSIDDRTVTIIMPQPTDGTAKADEQAVEIPAVAVQAMADKNAALEVDMDTVKIKLDTDELKAINDKGTDLYFKVVPIKDSTEQSKLGANAKTNGAVIDIAKSLGNGVVVPLGVPYTVETNYSGVNTKLLIPFTGMTIPTENKAAFLDSLRVYIEHTDGTKEAKAGTIVYDGSKNPIGIEITIDRFSSFQIISVQQPKANAAAIIPQTGSSIDTVTLIISGMLIMLSGFGILRFRRKNNRRS